MSYIFSPWTPEEDELLKEVVETCKFGKDSVHFHQGKINIFNIFYIFVFVFT